MRVLRAIRDLLVITAGTLSAILYFSCILVYCVYVTGQSGSFLSDCGNHPETGCIVCRDEYVYHNTAVNVSGSRCGVSGCPIDDRYANLRRICDILAGVNPQLGAKAEHLITMKAYALYPQMHEYGFMDFDTGRLPLISRTELGGSSGTAVADFLLNASISGRIGLDHLFELQSLTSGGITAQELLKIIDILDANLGRNEFAEIAAIFAEKLGTDS